MLFLTSSPVAILCPNTPPFCKKGKLSYPEVQLSLGRIAVSGDSSCGGDSSPPIESGGVSSGAEGFLSAAIAIIEATAQANFSSCSSFSFESGTSKNS